MMVEINIEGGGFSRDQIISLLDRIQICDREDALAAKARMTPWELEKEIALELGRQPETTPIPMLLHCPECRGRHVDKGNWATKPHHTHACQHCGHVWRPAVVDTVGVQFLPGFKDP